MSSDSQLIVKQLLEKYEAKENNMLKYLAKVKCLDEEFDPFQIQRIPLFKNKRADVLSKLASTSFFELNKTVLVKVLPEPSYQDHPVNWLSGDIDGSDFYVLGLRQFTRGQS